MTGCGPASNSAKQPLSPLPLMACPYKVWEARSPAVTIWSQGCEELFHSYSADAFEVPNGYSLPYYSGISSKRRRGRRPRVQRLRQHHLNLGTFGSSEVIHQSCIQKAKNDVVELSTDYNISPALTLTSETGFNQDFLWSTEDYNRFNSAPGVFVYDPFDPEQRRCHTCHYS